MQNTPIDALTPYWRTLQCKNNHGAVQERGPMLRYNDNTMQLSISRDLNRVDIHSNISLLKIKVLNNANVTGRWRVASLFEMVGR